MLRMGQRYDREADLIFATRLGRLVDEEDLRERHFWPVTQAAGISRRKGDGPYVLRHTCVTLLILAGESPTAVAERVGDKVETIMAHYAHTVANLQVKVTATIDALAFGDS